MMDMLCIGLFGGMIFATIFIAIGVIVGSFKNNSEELQLRDNSDNDVSDSDTNVGHRTLGDFLKEVFGRHHIYYYRPNAREEILNELWNLQLKLPSHQSEIIVRAIEYIEEYGVD